MAARPSESSGMFAESRHEEEDSPGSAVTWSQLPEQHRFAMITNSLQPTLSLGGSPMKRYFLAFLLSLVPMFPLDRHVWPTNVFQSFGFYSTKVEPDHVLFAEGALKFFSDLSAKNNFTFDSTSNWEDMNDFNLGKYQVVVWLNDKPSKIEQKRAFQGYIENGGAWLGFHVAAYNDKDSNWPWFVISSWRRISHQTAGLHCLRSSPSMIVRIR